MAKWPTSGNVYPVTPKAYPAAPNAYPGTGIAAYPSDSATWLTVLGSLAWWVRPDMGYTMGTGVAAWADQSGNGVNFLQGTGSAQPALAAADLDGYSAVVGDGTNDLLAAAWARVAPGTQSFYQRFIIKQVTWVANDALFGDFASAGVGSTVEMVGVTPAVIQFNGSIRHSNTGGTVGSYFRLEVQYTNSAADYLKIGSVNQTGTNAGNNAGSGTMQLFAIGNSTLWGNVAIVEACTYLGTPDAAARAALDAIDAAKYPSAGF